MSQEFQHHRQQNQSFFFPPPSDVDEQVVESQILRDKMRFQGFEPAGGGEALDHHPQETTRGGGIHYETAGMLSEMFDFGGGGRPSAPAELVISGLVVDPQISGINTSASDSAAAAAAAMQLFLTNPQPRSPPQQQQQQHQQQQQFHGQVFHSPAMTQPQPQYTWIPDGSGAIGVVEGQGLSLSLASSLEAAAKAEEMRMSSAAGYTHPHEMMFFNGQEGRASSSNSLQQQQLHFGFGTASSSVFSLAAVNVLRNSKYTRPAQELLEEFCSVGRGHLKKSASTKLADAGNNPTASTSGVSSTPVANDAPPLSPSDRMEHQRRKVKLASMLDEVERRYSHYCEQMQMVVNSFDMVMGFGAAVPYTALAQKAMSRHFRCLKDTIQAQLKHSCEVLGEKDGTGGTGITKGETPRLKVLEQSLRKQRAFHQMGMMEQEAWRPQRGLPERSVNVLRAWLFEHFLNPYPSDADKHLLARQTGLSRNQVANWFINARVRLWKPMIEEMYQQDKSKGEDNGGEENDDMVSDEDEQEAKRERESSTSAQTPTPVPRASTTTTPPTTAVSHIMNALPESDPSLPHSFKTHLIMPNRQQQQPLPTIAAAGVRPTTNAHGFIQTTTSYSHVVDACNNHFMGTSTAVGGGGGGGGVVVDHHDNSGGSGPTMIRFGTTPITNAGDVSLTLGLRHGAAAAGGGRNHPPEKGGFSFRDFGTS